MRKVLIIFFLVLSLSIASLIILIELNKENKTIGEDVYSVRTNYYYTDNEDVKVKLYSTSSDSFIMSKSYDVIFESNEATLRVKLEDVYLDRSVFYEGIDLYEYTLSLNMDPNLKITNAKIVLSFEEYTFSVPIGNIYYYKTEGENIEGINYLSGLSFSNPFTSTGGILLSLEDSNINGEKIIGVSVPSLEAGVVSLDEIDKKETKIDSFGYYYYTNSCQSSFITVNNNTNLLISLSYNEDIYMSEFPIIITTDKNSYLVSSFKYLIINDLSLVKSVIEKGEFYGL